MNNNSPLVAALRAVLESMRRPHLVCEDCWYSCPKSSEGCCDDQADDDCTCGADYTNGKLDQALALLKALAAD